jgi:hypothetical protein
LGRAAGDNSPVATTIGSGVISSVTPSQLELRTPELNFKDVPTRPEQSKAEGRETCVGASKEISEKRGWGYAVFNYVAASDKFEDDLKSLSDCGVACHRKVKAKDYIFHPYQKR